MGQEQDSERIKNKCPFDPKVLGASQARVLHATPSSSIPGRRRKKSRPLSGTNRLFGVYKTDRTNDLIRDRARMAM